MFQNQIIDAKSLAMFYLGNAQIRNVELFHSGQEGWTDKSDPHFSVTFLNLGKVLQHTCTITDIQYVQHSIVIEGGGITH